MLFDFDGTLTRPGALDFPAVKREVGCPPGSLVLEWIEALPAGAQREDALAALERFELAAAAASAPNADAERVLRSLRAQGLKDRRPHAERPARPCDGRSRGFATWTPTTST